MQQICWYRNLLNKKIRIMDSDQLLVSLRSTSSPSTYEMHHLFHIQPELGWADAVQWQKEMYPGACTVQCRLNRNSQSRQFIQQQWLTEQLPILMNVNSCHICVSINDKHHDLGNARLLVPNRCVQLPEAISSQCCPLPICPMVIPQSFSLITPLYSSKFILPNYEFVLSALLFQNENNNKHTNHKTYGTFTLTEHLDLPYCLIFSKHKQQNARRL